MKKFFIIALMGVMSLGASAQILTSRSYNKSKTPTMWYARLGVSLDNIAGLGSCTFDNEDGKASLGTKAGFVVDFGFQRPIGKSGLYWGMELGLGNRGFSTKYENKWDDESEEMSVVTYNIMYSPFTIGYKYALTDDIKLDAHLGLFASYDFSHSLTLKEDGVKYEDGDNWDEFKSDCNYEEFDAGLQLGIGVWYKRFNFDITWQRGFTTLAEYEKYDSYDYATGNSSNLMLRLGVAF